MAGEHFHRCYSKVPILQNLPLSVFNLSLALIYHCTFSTLPQVVKYPKFFQKIPRKILFVVKSWRAKVHSNNFAFNEWRKSWQDRTTFLFFESSHTWNIIESHFLVQLVTLSSVRLNLFWWGRIARPLQIFHHLMQTIVHLIKCSRFVYSDKSTKRAWYVHLYAVDTSDVLEILVIISLSARCELGSRILRCDTPLETFGIQ